MSETFFLSNMAPQRPNLNRRIWARRERPSATEPAAVEDPVMVIRYKVGPKKLVEVVVLTRPVIAEW